MNLIGDVSNVDTGGSTIGGVQRVGTGTPAAFKTSGPFGYRSAVNNFLCKYWISAIWSKLEFLIKTPDSVAKVKDTQKWWLGGFKELKKVFTAKNFTLILSQNYTLEKLWS